MIPFAKPELGEEEAAAAREAILSGWVTQGPRVKEFERRFAAECGAAHAVAVSSCTAALHLALVAAGVMPDDEVIVPPHSFVATANAVVHAGARPVFADIDPGTLNLDPAEVEKALTPRTKAVLVAHQVGRPAELEELAALARRRGLVLVEDAACAIGSDYRGMRIGANRYSPYVCFSFHPRKVLTTGDGGMITAEDPAAAQRLRRLRQHGMSADDLTRSQSGRILTETYDEVGYNYRLTDVQAAIGLVQLRRLPHLLARRRQLAAAYGRALAGHPSIGLFHEPAHARWNHQTYLVRLRGCGAAARDAVMQQLLDAGIATRRGVMSIHREKPYAALTGGARFPHSEAASDECIALPLYPQMEEAQVRRASEALVRLVR